LLDIDADRPVEAVHGGRASYIDGYCPRVCLGGEPTARIPSVQLRVAISSGFAGEPEPYRRTVTTNSNPTDYDGRHERERSGSRLSPSPTDDRPTLQLAVVSYEEGADRGTIHPPGLTGLERMETWLSVDLAAVVDLSAYR